MKALDRKFHKNQGFPKKSGNELSNQSGSVIFIIFILIALLAALAYAVSQGTRSGQNNLSKQQADLIASDVINYANAVRSATRNLQIKGCRFGDCPYIHSKKNFLNDFSFDVLFLLCF